MPDSDRTFLFLARGPKSLVLDSRTFHRLGAQRHVGPYVHVDFRADHARAGAPHCDAITFVLGPALDPRRCDLTVCYVDDMRLRTRTLRKVSGSRTEDFAAL